MIQPQSIWALDIPPCVKHEDKYLIEKFVDPDTGYKLEHRRSVFPKGDAYWRASDSWEAWGTGETAERAIENLKRSTSWREAR